MIDIREVLGKGEYGEGVVDGATEVENHEQTVSLWVFTLTIGKVEYAAGPCFLQTEGWQPRKGDKVRFDRQPEGVDDTYLHASRVGE